MKSIFVTGTDTGVGKTIVTAFLARYMLEKGRNVITQKWVQTGCPEFSLSDAAFHLKIMGRDKYDIKGLEDYVLPYMFGTPSSPHLASSIEDKKIRTARIVKGFKVLSKGFDFVIVEGSGGVLVPYNKKGLIIDIVKKLDLAVLVVAQNKLGAINHTLLSIEALRRRNIEILGIVFNNLEKEDIRIIKDNPCIISALIKENVFGVLPWIEKPEKLYERFVPIAEKICRKLKHG